jgi:hypothetical protein
MVLIWAIFQGMTSPRHPEEGGIGVSKAISSTFIDRLGIAKPFGYGPGVQKKPLVLG